MITWFNPLLRKITGTWSKKWDPSPTPETTHTIIEQTQHTHPKKTPTHKMPVPPLMWTRFISWFLPTLQNTQNALIEIMTKIPLGPLYWNLVVKPKKPASWTVLELDRKKPVNCPKGKVTVMGLRPLQDKLLKRKFKTMRHQENYHSSFSSSSSSSSFLHGWAENGWGHRKNDPTLPENCAGQY